MKRSWWYRFVFFMIVVTISVITVLPTVFKFGDDSHYPIKSKIALGLDLQGGLYMVLGIDFNRVYKDEIKKNAIKLVDMLNDRGVEAKLGELILNDLTDPQHIVILSDQGSVEKAEKEVRNYFGSYLRLTAAKGTTLHYGLSKTLKTEMEEQSVKKSIEVIRNRIDEFGVTEPDIVSQGKDRIIIQLPGVKDIDRAKELIGKTAKLEFRIVNDDISPVKLAEWVKKAEDAQIIYKKGEKFSAYVEKLNEFLKQDLPQGYELVFQKILSKVNNEIETKIPYLVEASSLLSGDDLQDARVAINQQKNEPYVSMEFKSRGATLFEEITDKNKGKRMAIVLDGNVYSAPQIREKISGGNAQITLGGGSYYKAMNDSKDIALVLRAGALPVQLDFLEQRSVGPSLGQDSINKAVFASIVGICIVFLFVFFYYKISGFIAAITLTVNVLIILAVLVALEATLTLPGIAGIALTVGMAVDANIIIYERIRDEIRLRVSNYKAVDNGFDQAFWTILDANITTALAGIFLFNFGTGPIKGFAVTLLIGIAATVYTAYFVGRLMFEFYMNKVEGQDLSI